MDSSFSEKFSQFIPGISLDCVVFGYQDRTLHVLLLKYKGVDGWALPGGFLPEYQEMDAVAAEVLQQRTEVTDVFLEQFYTFSALNRGWDGNELSRSTFQAVLSQLSAEESKAFKEWFGQRFVSTAYLSMVDVQKVQPLPDFLSDKCTWKPVTALPPLVLDHEQMVQKALHHLRVQLNYLPIGRSLLPEKFTMGELQSLYEAIIGKALDRGNFQRKMLKLKILKRHEKWMTGAPNKAPYLYSIDNEAYDKLLKNGMGFI